MEGFPFVYIWLVNEPIFELPMGRVEEIPITAPFYGDIVDPCDGFAFVADITPEIVMTVPMEFRMDDIDGSAALMGSVLGEFGVSRVIEGLLLRWRAIRGVNVSWKAFLAKA